MQQYFHLSDEEIQKIRDSISNTLKDMKSDVKKDKLKALGKTILAVLVIAGGVTVSILFPNPITVGVLGGAAALISGSGGLLRKRKKIKEKTKEKNKNKAEIKNLDAERINRKVANDMYARFREKDKTEPSVPNLYPDLKKL